MTSHLKLAWRSTFLAALLGFSLFITGCAATEEMMDKTMDKAAEMHGDGAITKSVMAALNESDKVNAENIVVETMDGEVMLSGSVANKKEKRAAMQIANTIDGVLQLQNNIEVAP